MCVSFWMLPLSKLADSLAPLGDPQQPSIGSTSKEVMGFISIAETGDHSQD